MDAEPLEGADEAYDGAMCLICTWRGPVDDAADHTDSTSHPTVYRVPGRRELGMSRPSL